MVRPRAVHTTDTNWQGQPSEAEGRSQEADGRDTDGGLAVQGTRETQAALTLTPEQEAGQSRRDSPQELRATTLLDP